MLEELGLAPGQYMLSAKGETCLHLGDEEKGGASNKVKVRKCDLDTRGRKTAIFCYSCPYSRISDRVSQVMQDNVIRYTVHTHV